jgi:hypothetical protein
LIPLVQKEKIQLQHQCTHSLDVSRDPNPSRKGLDCQKLLVESLSLFIFFFKFANPLTFPAIQNGKRKKKWFCMEPVKSGLNVRFEPVSPVNQSDQPVLPVLVTLLKTITFNTSLARREC